eukprot:CAMPEP_0171124696 /NCGR_PEP_ID=MMETSP0766_2-20121228/109679_1 /TAXON_ID=439317 /ORGANISM="Gambierdiscus australes, Strain CAWD 149" /LENGTH=37 /DNA_ID= /DNA_START= /DNA_END= /DNA_ORIENTATION=
MATQLVVGTHLLSTRHSELPLQAWHYWRRAAHSDGFV